jgi:sugar (pentulose or hexulose) kinase
VLADKLPPLISSDQPAGHLSAATAKSLGLSTATLVSAGGGDNMMGAIGTGNTRPGIVTASFGTSGTIYACAAKPIIDPQGEIAAFCDSTNRWLPLLCTMNVTVATEMVRNHYGLSHAQFENAAAKVSTGSDGLILLPYLEGERTPNVPDGTGVWFGANTKTHSAGHFARAAMEGVTLGMNYGLRRLASLGVKPKQIRATGGGAQSRLWRQIMADIFNAEVVTLAVSEGAAYGAALQAMWCVAQNRCEKVSINDLSDQFVKLNPRQTAHPNKSNNAVYREIQAIQDQLSIDLRGVFSRHRKFLDC